MSNPNNNPFLQPPADLAASIETSQESRAFLEEILSILNEAQEAIDRLNPQCDACGDCCKFDRAGHRLFVTTGELALLISKYTPISAKKLRCCYQQKDLCTARTHRPLGCRVFFCNKDEEEANIEIIESFHRQIVDSHKRHNIPYHYFELTGGLEFLIN